MREYLRSDDLAEGFREAAEAAIRWVREIPDRTPLSPGAPDAELDRFFRDGIADEGIGLKAAVEEFRDKLADRCMAVPHPLYLGLVNSSPLPGGMIADLFISVFNNNAGAAEHAPPATSAERAVIGFLCDRLGLEGWTGLILPGGAMANLTALVAARDRHFPEWQKKGPTALDGDPVFYMSEDGHFSLPRAARVIGTGDASVHTVPTLGRGTMDPSELERMIRSDRRAGRLPFCVVATSGTTPTGAFDPIEEIAEVASARGLWLHVDAAYGGAVCLSEKHRSLMNGIEKADSVTIDPHKWFFIPVTAGAVLMKDRDALIHSHDIGVSYIPTDAEEPDAFRLAYTCSRRASALKVWFAWRAHGIRTVREAVERNIDLTDTLEERLVKEGFEVLPESPISVALARALPEGVSGEALDRFQVDLSQAVIQSGVGWFSTVTHDSKTWLRFNMLNLYTRKEDIDRLVETLLSCRSRLEKG